MSEGERGDPDTVRYEAKDEEDLKWWQLDIICGFVGKADKTRTWRWHRDHAENGCGTRGYDFENLRFIEISHSREYCSDFNKSGEIKPEKIIRVVD